MALCSNFLLFFFRLHFHGLNILDSLDQKLFFFAGAAVGELTAEGEVDISAESFKTSTRDSEAAAAAGAASTVSPLDCLSISVLNDTGSLLGCFTTSLSGVSVTLFVEFSVTAVVVIESLAAGLGVSVDVLVGLLTNSTLGITDRVVMLLAVSDASTSAADAEAATDEEEVAVSADFLLIMLLELLSDCD